MLAATSLNGDSFKGFILENRIQKVQRFSFQRPFTEAYRYDSPMPELTPAVLAVSPEKQLIPRGVRYPSYTVNKPLQLFAAGKFTKIAASHPITRDRSLTGIGPELKGFPENELELCPMVTLQDFDSIRESGDPASWDSSSFLRLEEQSWQMVDFGAQSDRFCRR